jgi:hypothetical protein
MLAGFLLVDSKCTIGYNSGIVSKKEIEMDYNKHLEIVTNWGMYHNIQGGMLETLQAMQACGADELHRDERRAVRDLMVGFQQLLAPVDQ